MHLYLQHRNINKPVNKHSIDIKMQTLIITLFILAIASFSMHLQLLKNKYVKLGWLVAVAVFIYSMHHYAIEQSYTSFRAALGNRSLMMDFTIIQVIEALAGLLLSIFLMRFNFNEPVKKLFRYGIYLPGFIVFPALFYLESIVFLQVQGVAFNVLAVTMALGSVLIIYFLAYGFSRLIPEYDLQLELKFIVHLLQLLGGIVLSVVMLRLPVHSATQEIALTPFLVLLAIVVSGIVAGIIWYRVKIKRLKIRLRIMS